MEQEILLQHDTQYLAGLANKHLQKMDFVKTFLDDKQNFLEDEIIGGKYQIKKLTEQTQQTKFRNPNSRGRKQSMQRSKKQLQDQYEYMQQGINQLNDKQTHKPIPEEQRKAFIKKIEKQRRQLLKKKQDVLKAVKERKALQDKRIKEERSKEDEEKKQKKKKQIEDKMRSMSELRNTRKVEFQNTNKILKEKMKQKYLMEKIEEQYYKNQNEALEERKKKLAQIRSFHKPIDKKQLDQFSEKFDQMKAQKLAALQDQQEEPKHQINFYKSIFYQKIKKQNRQYEDKRSQQVLEKLKQTKSKMKNYSQNVRTNFKPTIKQRTSMDLKGAERINRSVDVDRDGYKLGLRYLGEVKQQIRLLGPRQQQKNEQEQEDKEKVKGKYINYLQQQKSKHKNQKVVQSAEQYIKRLDKQNLSKHDKAKKIMQFTQEIQRKAKRRQQLDKVRHNNVDDELDQLYLEAIQAKLSLLDI